MLVSSRSGSLGLAERLPTGSASPTVRSPVI